MRNEAGSPRCQSLAGDTWIVSRGDETTDANKDSRAAEPGKRDRLDAYYELGEQLQVAGEFDAAADAFRRAIELGHAKACRRLGDVLYELDEWGEMVEVYTRAAEAGEMHYHELGAVLDELGAYGDPEEAFRAGIDRGESESAFRLSLSLLRWTEDNGPAETTLRAADELGHSRAPVYIGLLLERREEYGEAEAAYQRAADRGDAYGSFKRGLILKNRGALKSGEAACRWGEVEFQRVQRKEQPFLAGSIGDFFYNLGYNLADLNTAEIAYRRADARGNAYAAWRLGILLESCGDRDGAEAAYRRAVDRGTQDETWVSYTAEYAARDLRRLRDPDSSEHREPNPSDLLE